MEHIYKDRNDRARVSINEEGINIAVGGEGDASGLSLYSDFSLDTNLLRKSIGFWNTNGLVVGGTGKSGSIKLKKDVGERSKTTVEINAKTGNISAGGHGTDGDLQLFPTSANNHSQYQFSTIRLSAGDPSDNHPSAIVKIGGGAIGNNRGVSGQIRLFPSGVSNEDGRDASIRIDGERGDISLLNADIAEEFDIRHEEAVEPGSVMAIADETGLSLCDRAYDPCAVGVVSGAGAYQPALVLDQQKQDGLRQPIALAGKVCCKVDARLGSIKPGDLLTTSSTPGHAMVASDANKRVGTVIGKSLASVADGCALIPIVVFNA